MKKLVVIAVLFAALAGTVYAQNSGISGGMGMRGWESPQSAATAGRLRSAADDFIRPDSYTSARIGNWFGMTSFANLNSVHLGFAKQLEGVYIAAYYGGSFGYNFPSNTFTEGNVTWRGDDKVVPIYATIGIGADRPNNNAAILIGVADMGFRLAFASTYETFQQSDFINGTTSYKNYKTEGGIIVPQFAWSIAKNLTENGIKPYLTVDLAFNRDYTKYQTYQAAAPYDAEDEIVSTSANYIQPIIAAGLGGFTFVNKNGFSGSADLDYVFRLTSFDNEYNYLDANGNRKTKSFNGLNNNGTLTENDYTYNEFIPSVSGSWNGDKLRLRFKLNLPVQLTNTETTALAFETGTSSGKLVKNGTDQSIATVAFAPNLRLAAQWQAASKLFLNIGGRINVSTVTNTTTESKTFTQGIKNANSSTKTYSTTYANTNNYLYFGTTIPATDNLTLELTSGVSLNGGNNVNVFGTGTDGMLYLTSLLASLKF
jgi:hypothetical protein